MTTTTIPWVTYLGEQARNEQAIIAALASGMAYGTITMSVEHAWRLHDLLADLVEAQA